MSAETLRIGRTRVYELLAAGVIPSIKLGRSVRVSTDELKKWIAGQRQLAGQDSALRKLPAGPGQNC